ncbi:hypothetical protein Trydic_g1740 [Trypoxylus dichotomus]
MLFVQTHDILSSAFGTFRLTGAATKFALNFQQTTTLQFRSRKDETQTGEDRKRHRKKKKSNEETKTVITARCSQEASVKRPTFYVYDLHLVKPVKDITTQNSTKTSFQFKVNHLMVKSANTDVWIKKDIASALTNKGIKVSSSAPEAPRSFTRTLQELRQKITVARTEIEWSSMIEYLGMILVKRLTFSEHLKRTRTRAIGRISQLYPLLFNPGLHPETGIMMQKKKSEKVHGRLRGPKKTPGCPRQAPGRKILDGSKKEV